MHKSIALNFSISYFLRFFWTTLNSFFHCFLLNDAWFSCSMHFALVRLSIPSLASFTFLLILALYPPIFFLRNSCLSHSSIISLQSSHCSHLITHWNFFLHYILISFFLAFFNVSRHDVVINSIVWHLQLIARIL